MKKRFFYALAGLGAAAAIGAAAFLVLRPRPTRLSVTPRTGDDTVVVNQMHAMRLGALVLDQYGRRLRADTAVQYRWISGDTVRVASNGEVRCIDHRDAVVRAAFGALFIQIILRCRPVCSIEAVTWLDLVVGDSTRDLSFVAHGPDGRAV